LGYTETEIEVIANWARYHQKNLPKKKHDNVVILTKKYREVVSKLHPFLRLAVALDRRQIGAISDFKCEIAQKFESFICGCNRSIPQTIALWNSGVWIIKSRLLRMSTISN